MGRSTKDTELIYTPAGLAVATVTVAVNGNRKEDKAEFFTVKSFGKTAEFMAKWWAKGKRGMVEGRLHNNIYEKDGQKKTFTEIITDKYSVIDWPNLTQAEQEVASVEDAAKEVFHGEFELDDSDLPF